jgi:hypothetical protein
MLQLNPSNAVAFITINLSIDLECWEDNNFWHFKHDWYESSFPHRQLCFVVGSADFFGLKLKIVLVPHVEKARLHFSETR